MPTFKIITKVIFGVFFIAAGANHFINPKFYLNIMPPYLPWHYALVVISGIADASVLGDAITRGINNAAMNHLTKYLARELAKDQITANDMRR